MPRIVPDERYFSIPSAEVGGDVRRKRALNCWPWVRSLTHSPEAVIHSPALTAAAYPTTVTSERCPRALVAERKTHSRHYGRSPARRGPPALRGLKTLAACPLSIPPFGLFGSHLLGAPHRTSMLHSRRRDRASPPAVLPKLHSASRKTLSPRRRVSITRPATATQPGLARAQWPPQHAHMIHPYGNPAFARPSRMR